LALRCKFVVHHFLTFMGLYLMGFSKMDGLYPSASIPVFVTQ